MDNIPVTREEFEELKIQIRKLLERKNAGEKPKTDTYLIQHQITIDDILGGK